MAHGVHCVLTLLTLTFQIGADRSEMSARGNVLAQATRRRLFCNIQKMIIRPSHLYTRAGQDKTPSNYGTERLPESFSRGRNAKWTSFFLLLGNNPDNRRSVMSTVPSGGYSENFSGHYFSPRQKKKLPHNVIPFFFFYPHVRCLCISAHMFFYAICLQLLTRCALPSQWEVCA